MKQMIKYIVLLILSLLQISCGEGKVDINDIDYEPKIVVEAMIYPGDNVKNIKISRNFRLTLNQVDKNNIYISNANVILKDGNKNYVLSFDPATKSYNYQGNDLIIEYNKTYNIEVSATIDGKLLKCYAQTYTPAESLIVLLDKTIKNNDTIRYYKSKLPEITFKPISNIYFYAIANDFMDKADSLSFIHDNILGVEYKDVKEKIVNYKQRFTWLQNIKNVNIPISKSLDWFDFFFYGKYRLTLYAGNEDFNNYFQTASNTQEMDGNFHHPRFNIKGDGIGYFAAAKKFSIEYYLIKR